MLCRSASHVPAYRRREPEATLLYRVVSGELDRLRADLGEASPYGRGFPRHVDKDLEAYLACGILARGFARVVCRECHAEHLVASAVRAAACAPVARPAGCTTRRRIWSIALSLRYPCASGS